MLCPLSTSWERTNQTLTGSAHWPAIGGIAKAAGRRRPMMSMCPVLFRPVRLKSPISFVSVPSKTGFGTLGSLFWLDLSLHQPAPIFFLSLSRDVSLKAELVAMASPLSVEVLCVITTLPPRRLSSRSSLSLVPSSLCRSLSLDRFWSRWIPGNLGKSPCCFFSHSRCTTVMLWLVQAGNFLAEGRDWYVVRCGWVPWRERPILSTFQRRRRTGETRGAHSSCMTNQTRPCYATAQSATSAVTSYHPGSTSIGGRRRRPTSGWGWACNSAVLEGLQTASRMPVTSPRFPTHALVSCRSGPMAAQTGVALPAWAPPTQHSLLLLSTCAAWLAVAASSKGHAR